jgi:hypothetical protein
VRNLENWKELLRNAAETGEPLALGPADPDKAALWGPSRCIPAEALRQVLLSCGDFAVDPRGLTISGARFEDRLDLANVVFPHPLCFKDCSITGQIDLCGAALKELSFTGTHTAGIDLDGAEITGDLLAKGLCARGEVRALGCQIGGQLILNDAELHNIKGDALSLDGAKINGDVVAQRLQVVGTFRAVGVQIGGQLNLISAGIIPGNFKALTLDGAKIAGDVFATGLKTNGGIRALGVQIGGGVNLVRAYLFNPRGDALQVDRAQITRDLFANDLVAVGAVRALGAQIGGRFELGGANAEIRNPGRDALRVDGAKINGGFYAGGLRTYGAVRAFDAVIGEELNLVQAQLRNPSGDALNLDGTKITGGVDARKLVAEGSVRLVGVHIDAELNLEGAILTKANRVAMSLGEVIAGGYSLSLRGAVVSGDVSVRHLIANAEVRAPGARLGGVLDLRGALLNNPSGVALNLTSASIKRLTLGSLDDPALLGVCVDGVVSLYGAEITNLCTDANPPGPLVATGWKLTDIEGPLRSDRDAAQRWLEKSTQWSAQPWHALAGVYERNGEPAAGKKLRFEAARKVTRHAEFPAKIPRIINGAVIGYGYYPLRTAFWLPIVVLIGCLLILINRNDFVSNQDVVKAAANSYLEQTHSKPPAEPVLNPIVYTLSALLPTAVGTATSEWTVRPGAAWLTGVFIVLKLVAWVLVALFLAGISGLLRKD